MPRRNRQRTGDSRQRKPRKELRVLAVDPGFGRAGVAVIARVRGNDTLLYSTCIQTASAAPFPKRLHVVVETIAALLATYRPNLFALERLYFTSNQKTAMQVAEVRGALIALAAARAIPVVEYGPSEVKVAVTGWGKSGKQEVMRMLPRLITLPDAGKRRLDDEYDAIAIALTALASVRIRNQELGT